MPNKLPTLVRSAVISGSLFVLAGCAQRPGNEIETGIRPPNSFLAQEFDIQHGTLRGTLFKDYENREIEVQGVLSGRNKETPELLIPSVLDRDTIPDYSFYGEYNCVNLVMRRDMNRELQESAKRKVKIVGNIFTISALTGDILFFRYKGIEFTPTCQYYYNGNDYPYIYVTRILR